MSYDIFLKPKNGRFVYSEFENYFASRENYSLEGNQAWYQNENTGVYFHFLMQEECEEIYPVAFYVSYFRASYFAYEAESEVNSFITKFSMVVDNPQLNVKGDYNSVDFLTGWAHGNELAYQSILNNRSNVIALPEIVLDSVWEWNYNKENLQNSVIDNVFVPRIMLLMYQGNPVTAVVWPDAIPSIIPKVDILIIGRKEFAPQKSSKKVDDMAIALWSDFQPLFEKYKKKMLNDGYYLYYNTVPPEIGDAVSSLPVSDYEIEGVAFDQVLNRELVQKCNT